MITRQIVSFEELIKDIGFWDSVCGLVHDETSLIDKLKEISELELHQIYHNESNIGFFTVERHSSKLIEVHAYINPDSRRYSIAALKEMDAGNPESIATSVWGTHSHVEKVLERMGFKHDYTEEGELLKGGKVYDIKHFIKEKNNGK